MSNGLIKGRFTNMKYTILLYALDPVNNRDPVICIAVSCLSLSYFVDVGG